MIVATKRRHRPEQVVRKPSTADRLLAEGADLATLRRELGVSEATFIGGVTGSLGLKAVDANG